MNLLSTVNPLTKYLYAGAALALAAVLAFTHLTAYRKGKNDVRLEWRASVAAANEEARRMERRRQAMVDEATQDRAKRETALRAATARVASERDGLQHAVDVARERGAQSLEACRTHAATLEAVFGECRGQLQEVGRDADGHAADSLMLQRAWPK